MGWTEQQLAEATPAYLAALRWLLLTEKVWPTDQWWEAPLPDNLPLPQKVAAVEQRSAAREQLQALRSLLFPED